MGAHDKHLESTLNDPIIGRNLKHTLNTQISIWHYFARCGRKLDRYTLAIHEVGHAVVALYVGLPVYEARLIDKDSPERSTADGVVHLTPPKNDWYVDRDKKAIRMFSKSPVEVVDQVTIRMATLNCAGWVAELLLARVNPGPTTLVSVPGTADWEHAVYYAGQYRTSNVLLACQRSAFGILGPRWGLIEKLANLLDSNGRISGEEINQVMTTDIRWPDLRPEQITSSCESMGLGRQSPGDASPVRDTACIA